MSSAVEAKRVRAVAGDETVNGCLAAPGGGLGGANVVATDIGEDSLEDMLGSYMSRKIRRAWSDKDTGPGVSSDGKFVVAGLQLGNVFVFVQPLLGVEGDPMRLLFERVRANEKSSSCNGTALLLTYCFCCRTPGFDTPPSILRDLQMASGAKRCGRLWCGCNDPSRNAWDCGMAPGTAFGERPQVLERRASRKFTQHVHLRCE